MSGAPLIDRAVLDELSESIGAEGVRSVLELFIDESANYLQAIAPAAAPGADAAARDRARRAVHSLKSGAGQIGAAALAAAAAAVEHAAAADAPDLPRTIAQLEERWAASDAALRQLLNGR